MIHQYVHAKMDIMKLEKLFVQVIWLIKFKIKFHHNLLIIYNFFKKECDGRCETCELNDTNCLTCNTVSTFRSTLAPECLCSVILFKKN